MCPILGVLEADRAVGEHGAPKIDQASPVATDVELTPENMELLACYSCPGGRVAAARPALTSGTYL